MKQQQIVFQTRKKIIRLSAAVEQLSKAHDAVIDIYDNVYHAAGTPSSEELHKACIQRKVDIDKINDIDNVHVMG